MLSEISLSVLDQSPMRKGGSPAEALRESVRLAQAAEGLGYRRYWVAEHHNANSYVGTCPELLISLIASNTKSIRVGSGGVMLLNYSALKVAETFRVLEALYPGRIDLGIGRAAGGDPLAAGAMSHPRSPVDARQFPRQVVDLIGFLGGTLDDDHPFAGVTAQPGPAPDSLPEVWLLGSSRGSAELAAETGLPFAFADFLCNTREDGPAAAESYRRSFRPSNMLSAPKFCVALDVICAPGEEEARMLARSRNFDRVAEVYGVRGLVPASEVPEYPMTEEVRRFMQTWARNCIDGPPEQVRASILELARLYGTGDIAVVTNCYAFEDRVRSYELLARAFR